MRLGSTRTTPRMLGSHSVPSLARRPLLVLPPLNSLVRKPSAM
jgi:hypothetical protein